MNIINLTPHAITFINENNEKEVFEASGNIARVEQFVFSIPDTKYNLKTTVPDCVVGLPRQDINCVYIVSAMVREAEKTREDLWSPAEFVRDEQGVIIGCTAFICN